MCYFLPSTRAEITFPKALRDKLIFAAYLIPSSLKFVLLCLSDPAKSTKLSFPTLNFWTPFWSYSLSSILIVNMQWDLEDSLFIEVYLMTLFLYPISIYFSMSVTFFAKWTDKSFIINPSGVYCKCIFALMSFPNKSWISSL